MTTGNLERIIDGDGHVMEDLPAIIERMDPSLRSPVFRDPFPPLDHLHGANKHFLPEGAFQPAEYDEWVDFLDTVGLESTILYTTRGLAFGKILNKDWAIDLARAYNDWLYDTYTKRSDRFKGLALIPLQDPQAAVKELRRAVEDLGMVGAYLPSTGAAQRHLGEEMYWPIYEEANRLKCCIGIHGGAHESMGLDDLTPYAPVHGLGHAFGQMISFAGIVFNGIFDRYPDVRIGFMEAGCSWLIACYERFSGSWASHVAYDPNKRFLDIRKGESVGDYIQRHIDEDRIYVGVEGDEAGIAYAVDLVGAKPFVWSSDFPHEVNKHTVMGEIDELKENPKISDEDKDAILYRNAERFYGLA